MDSNETVDWKSIAIQERTLREQAEQQRAQLASTLQKAKLLLNRTTGYNTYLEQRAYDLESKLKTETAKLETTVEMLKKAKRLLQQRKMELEILTTQRPSSTPSTSPPTITPLEAELEDYFVYKTLDATN